MYCQYLSHRYCDSRILARVGPDYVKATQPKGSVCIRTCHRLEFCSNTPFELPPPPSDLARAWCKVSGIEQVLIRLATVAAGADSKILGEQFIAHQCSRPFLKTHVPDLPFDLIAGAFDIASRLKKSMRFETTFSYDDAAFSLLRADAQRPRPSALVVFGAGIARRWPRPPCRAAGPCIGTIASASFARRRPSVTRRRFSKPTAHRRA
jgi:hypothetical protein